ncbi:MAG: DUF1851 domain-containing protein [Flavobacteriaceae bacterium]|nr:DUF1851 domain-containing protein [Flavobacteriaceae bacterium]
MGLLGNIFGKDEEKSNQHNDMFKDFVSKFPPAENLTKPTDEMLSWYADKLPKHLLDFWENYGFGNYGNGLIKVVEPSEYMDSLYSWLGIEEDFTKLPILITAFGDIYYYRKLSDTDDDISLLDIHYRKIDVCTYNFEDFFTDYIINNEISAEDLKEELFEDAVNQKGNLDYEEIFFFVPALMLGGNESVEFIDKGIGVVHQSLLLQMG